MDKITRNQLFKSLKKINVEHLKSTNNWELEITNSRNFVFWRTICWMETGKFEKIQLNLRRTQKWKTCCNNVTKQERSALEKIEDSTLPLYSTFRTIQLQFMSRSDYFVAKRAMSSSKWLTSAIKWKNSRNSLKILKTSLILNNVHFNNYCCAILWCVFYIEWWIFGDYMYLTFSKHFFIWNFFLLRMSWDIGCSRNIFLSLRDKSKVFHVRLHHELKRYSYTVLEAQNFFPIWII